ncbi:DUF302 domain-containing protein [Williamsia sp. CHRR-6]|uniref:DUF302 domain-containing protein n=1 Tax=Williamsia sp. CHRR-6 TaxID=2835871 RepID=UPI001BD91322|nr:DUF302 domain-containing protein [Williamsia sp. CHRR-6]MBT0567501.1 DUF302 domain-containing protein [Williamsia sp. CHRR-6]
MSSTLALSTSLTGVDFDTAIEKTTAALADQGFGVLTEIDVTATMKKKLDADVEPYRILGACNPTLAHQAIGIMPQIGLLLPCNVVVRADRDDPSGQKILIEAMNPDLMVRVTDEPGLAPVAQKAGELLAAAIASIR